MFSSSVFLLINLIATTWSFPHTSNVLHLRNSSSDPLAQGINATITDSTGLDVTSNFKTMVYREPLNLVSFDSLNGRSVLNRRTPGVRSIDHCTDLRGNNGAPLSFSHSFCHSATGTTQNLQSYTYVCREPDRPLYNPMAMRGDLPGSGMGAEHRGQGQCDDKEICVDFTDRAWCIETQNYIEIVQHGGLIPAKLDTNGKVASAIFTKQDGTTPLDVGTLSIDAAGSSGSGGSSSRQSQSCSNCHELSSKSFGPDTSLVGIDATMKTVAAAGILWLALLVPATG